MVGAWMVMKGHGNDKGRQTDGPRRKGGDEALCRMVLSDFSTQIEAQSGRQSVPKMFSLIAGFAYPCKGKDFFLRGRIESCQAEGQRA